MVEMFEDVIQWPMPDFLFDSNSDVCSLTVYEIFANKENRQN